MPDDVVPGVTADSPQPGADTAPPAAGTTPQVPGSEQGTPLPTTPPAPVEEARVPLSRLNEVIEQRKAAEAREARLLEALQRTAPPAQPAQPDFWAGRVDHPDPATAQYWQGQKQMVELAVQQGKQAAITELQPVIQAGMQRLVALDLKDFRRENPDIPQGSQEEAEITARIRQGYPLEEAKRIVMYDVLQKRLAQHATTQTHRTAAQKQQASPEGSPGIPATAGGTKAKGSFEETLSAELQAEGF